MNGLLKKTADNMKG